jgi:ribulose 1,5-bisphosphate carboxylase large subunit-like protein
MFTNYQIMTETRDNLSALTAKHFDAFTLRHGAGVWKGESEASTTIELVCMDADTRQEFKARVYSLAKLIKDTNKQQAVLVLEVPVVATLV